MGEVSSGREAGVFLHRSSLHVKTSSQGSGFPSSPGIRAGVHQRPGMVARGWGLVSSAGELREQETGTRGFVLGQEWEYRVWAH